MALSNFHVHSSFCDGEGDPEDYIKKAINYGFYAIGFSSHAPVPFENSWTMKASLLNEYCDTIRRLKVKYEGIIQIYLGLEIDYLGVSGPRSPLFKELGLDYTIGSVHFVRCGEAGDYTGLDGNIEDYIKILEGVYKGNIEAFVKGYYKLIRDMVKIHTPSIIGHLDLIKKNNVNEHFFSEDEEWYRVEVQNTLEYIAQFGSVLEVNTGGIARKYTTDLYPSRWILKECRRLNIPVILNSDAHKSENLVAYYREAVDILIELGYNEQHILFNQNWHKVELVP